MTRHKVGKPAPLLSSPKTEIRHNSTYTYTPIALLQDSTKEVLVSRSPSADAG